MGKIGCSIEPAFRLLLLNGGHATQLMFNFRVVDEREEHVLYLAGTTDRRERMPMTISM